MCIDNILVLGNFTWDRTTHYLKPLVPNDHSEDPKTLTNKQKALLSCLVDAHPNTISNTEIIKKVWGNEHISQESLPQLINRTRRVLEDSQKNILVNKPGIGYSLNFEFAPKTLADNNVESLPPQPQSQAVKKSHSNRWRAVTLVLTLVTVFNVWHTAQALYYKMDFERVLHASPYSEIKKDENGNVIVTIDNHECIYHKDQLLLQCP
ncbi:winged helix-turn-helix domain-containing protein [Vibrio alfacsensis]|uniref:winged helix-turn-helix domain-containing protein n=1 Tax=Vibrio alfacsensis TaxID=1074311 RepID=UPI002ADE7867|nr:winged helix-turn-helix domain-containing protein [Vibrio alfacsensis]WQE75270.1 winged helix-turn-helix domain-containing protein [Vibrio alfacsensis]